MSDVSTDPIAQIDRSHSEIQKDPQPRSKAGLGVSVVLASGIVTRTLLAAALLLALAGCGEEAAPPTSEELTRAELRCEVNEGLSRYSDEFERCVEEQVELIRSDVLD